MILEPEPQLTSSDPGGIHQTTEESENSRKNDLKELTQRMTGSTCQPNSQWFCV